MRTRVKICGIRTQADLQCACVHGADAVGFNMYAESPRYIDADAAASLVAAAPPLIKTVGLFVNHAQRAVRSILEAVPFDMLQFHGDETDEYCTSFGRPFLKALRVGANTDISAEADRYPSAAGLLLDARIDGLWGGTGETFDWRAVPRLDRPLVLAGGLSPDNVEMAIRVVSPYAVDVSSGVESAPGVKDEGRVRAFMVAVRAADEAKDE